MSNELKISEFQSKRIREAAKDIDKKLGDNNKSINTDSEFAMLQVLLNGDLKNEVAMESDDVKKLLCFTASTSTTQAPVVTNPAEQKPVDESEADLAERAKANNMTVAEFEVARAFLEKRGYDPETGKTNGTTAKEAYKAVKKEFKGKGKEYDQALKTLKKLAKHDFAHVAADNAMMATSATDAYGNIVDESNLQYNTSKKVLKKAKQNLIDNNNGKLDKWEYRALKGKDKSMLKNAANWFSGLYSHEKKMRKGIAADNEAARFRTEEKPTLKDMKDAIGKRSPIFKESYTLNGQKVNVLEASGLIVNDGKGNYNIEKLSRLVRDAIGADATLNDHKNPNTRETQKIRTLLNVAFAKAGITDFDTAHITTRDIAQLTEFCRYYNDRPHNVVVDAWQGFVGGALTGAAAGAGSAAAATATNPVNIVKAPIDVNQHVGIPMNLGTEDLAQQLLDSLKDNPKLQGMEIVQQRPDGSITTEIGSITKIGAEVTIIVDQLVQQERYIEFSKYILSSAIKAAVVAGGVGALTGAIAGGMNHKLEKGILDIAADCDHIKTYEDAVAMIEAYPNLTRNQKNSLKQILFEGVSLVDKKDANGNVVKDKNGNPIQVAETIKVNNPVTGEEECKIKWNFACCEFFNELRRIAGNQELNAVELSMYLKKKGNLTETPEKAPCEQPQQEDSCPKPLIRQEVTPAKEITVPTTPFRAWGDIVNGYDCLKAKVYQKSYKVGNGYTTLANRMVKVLQAIKVDNVKTEDDIKKLYNIKTIAAFADEALRNGIDSAIAKFPALPISKEDYLTALGSKGGIKGNVYIPQLYNPDAVTDGDDGICSWNKKKPVTIVRSGSGSTGALGARKATTAVRTDSKKSCDGGKTWEPISNEQFEEEKANGATVVPVVTK